MDLASEISAKIPIDDIELAEASFSNSDDYRKTLELAARYYEADCRVLYRMVTNKNGEKYRRLYYNDNEIIYPYLTKYHSPKYAIGSLVMKLLCTDRGNNQQTNRILLRSPLLKYWTRSTNYDYWEEFPEVGRLNRWVLKWNEPYYEAVKPGMEITDKKTHGEIEISRLKQRLMQF